MKIAKQGPTNLYDSEIYRSLERQAYKEGFFTPSDKDIVKQASNNVKMASKVNDRMSAANLQPSENVDIDISMLVDGLRNRGYISQAQDVENNYIMFKKAETEYYNLSMETPNDLMDFAHPDGDINVTDIKGELADIETIQSAADKILAVVRKQPSGKLAALAGLIKKNAQEIDFNDKEKLDKAYSEFADIITSFDAYLNGLNNENIIVSLDNLTDDDNLEFYSSENKQNKAVVLKTVNIIKELKDLGFKKFDETEFLAAINNPKGNKIKEIARLLNVDESFFTGVSAYAIKNPQNTYSSSNYLTEESLKDYKLTGNDAINPKSIYIQVFDRQITPSNGLQASGYRLNSTNLELASNNLMVATKKLFSIVSAEKINSVNEKISKTFPMLSGIFQKCKEECVTPAGSINENGFIVKPNLAFSNFYKVIKDIETVFKDYGFFIFDMLKKSDQAIGTNKQNFITALNNKVSDSLGLVLKNSEPVDISDIFQDLIKANNLWKDRKNGEESTKIIQGYFNTLKQVLPPGQMKKPLSLVQAFLKSKGYENGNIDLFRADIKKLITMATPIQPKTVEITNE